MKLYKHVNNTEVAAEFKRVIKVPTGRKIKVTWYNIVNPNNIYPCGITEEIFIKEDDIKNWKVYK